MTLDFKLLKSEQIWPGGFLQDRCLDVMRKCGSRAAPTDLAILLGTDMGYYGWNKNHTSEGDPSCATWTSSLTVNTCVCSVTAYGGDDWQRRAVNREISVRPVLSAEAAVGLPCTNSKIGVNGVEIVEYGEYPQTVADKKTAQKLEKLYQSKSLWQTGKNYVFDGADPSGDRKTPFVADVCPEYELDGKKYIRLNGRPCSHAFDYGYSLSSGEKIIRNVAYWIQVEPIEWLKDPTGVLVSKKCLFAGIQFNTTEVYDGDFSKTFLKQYLDNYFAKQIEPSELVADKEQEKLNKKLAEEKRKADEVNRKVARGMAIGNLKGRLEMLSDPEFRKPVGKARSPERQAKAEEIIEVRRARTLLSRAANKALDEGDKELFSEIEKVARSYALHHRRIELEFKKKRAERRAKKDRG